MYFGLVLLVLLVVGTLGVGLGVVCGCLMGLGWGGGLHWFLVSWADGLQGVVVGLGWFDLGMGVGVVGLALHWDSCWVVLLGSFGLGFWLLVGRLGGFGFTLVMLVVVGCKVWFLVGSVGVWFWVWVG